MYPNIYLILTVILLLAALAYCGYWLVKYYRGHKSFKAYLLQQAAVADPETMAKLRWDDLQDVGDQLPEDLAEQIRTALKARSASQ